MVSPRYLSCSPILALPKLSLLLLAPLRTLRPPAFLTSTESTTVTKGLGIAGDEDGLIEAAGEVSAVGAIEICAESVAVGGGVRVIVLAESFALTKRLYPAIRLT